MSDTKQRMAGEVFTKGGFHNETDKNITNMVMSGQTGVDDSAEAQKSFVTNQQSMNAESQKKYEGLGKKTAQNYTGFRGGDVNMQALQGRIDNSVQNFYDRATVQEVKTYGDRGANPFNNVKFEFGSPIKPVESKAPDIAKEYKKELK